jgi:hypothetical protein
LELPILSSTKIDQHCPFVEFYFNGDVEDIKVIIVRSAAPSPFDGEGEGG